MDPRSGAVSVGSIVFALCLLTGTTPLLAQTAARRQIDPLQAKERVVYGHSDGVLAAAFLPDGNRFVTASADKTIKLWRADTGELLRTFAGHGDRVLSVAVSPDGKTIASGSVDKTIRVWDAASGEQVGQLEGHTLGVVCVAFLKDGRLISGARDGLRLWDVKQEKLLWKKHLPREIWRMATSADASRAVLTEAGGVTSVWDVNNRREMVRFGQSVFVPDCVAITPDGKQVYYMREDGNPQLWMCRDVESGKEVPLTDHWDRPQCLGFTTDGKYVINGGAPELQIFDAVTHKYVGYFEAGRAETGHCLAMSPDGHTLVYGTGGQVWDDGWHPGRDNHVSILQFKDPRSAVVTGKPEGQLSWEVIPAKVRTSAGQTVPFTEYRWVDPFRAQFRKMDDQLDVVWSPSQVLLHREKGLLEEVLNRPGLDVADVAWDGEHLWVASKTRGLSVLSRTGEELASGSSSEGLFPAEWALVIHPLSAGKVLAAGSSSRGRSWCAVATYDSKSEGAQIRFKVLCGEPGQMPAGWDPGSGSAMFRPQWVVEEPAPPAGSRSIWIGSLQQTRQSAQPVIRVDAGSLATSFYNFTGDAPGARDAENLGRSGPLFLNDHEALLFTGDQVMRAGPGPRMAAEGRKLVADWHYPYPLRMLRWDGRIVLPGPHWLTIDEKTLEPLNIGSGLRVNGKLVTDNTCYGVSAHLGLCAFSAIDGCFYRFSWDEQHPLAVRATADVPMFSEPVSDEGFVENSHDALWFHCGRGVITSRAGRVTASDFDIMNGRQYPPAFDILARLQRFPEERQRIGLTDQQYQQLRQVHVYQRPQPDINRLSQLCAAYEQADNPEAKKRAARPILDEAKAFAEQDERGKAEFTNQFRAAFTDRQWKMLNYEK